MAYGLFLGALVLAGCDRTAEGLLDPEATGDPSFSGSGPWAEMVTGGGQYTHTGQGFTEWISASVRKSADGQVSGMLEYANEGLQGWRYKTTAECLAVSADGTKAVAIGAVSLAQGPEAPTLGTRVVFGIEDNGPAKDRTVTLFAGAADCDYYLFVWETFPQFVPPLSDVNNGNFSIARR